MAGERDEVAIRTDVLPDLAVILGLFNPAIIREARLVVGARGGHPCLGAMAGEIAGLDHAEHAMERTVARAVGDDVAVADATHRAEIILRHHGVDVDGAANRSGGWAVDVGRTEVDVDAFDDFRVNLLVGVDRVVARVVERNTVKDLRDTIRAEAADGEAAARRTPRIVVGEADARHQIDDFVDRLARTLTFDDFLRQNDLRLRRVRDLHAADALVDGRASHDDRVFEILRTGRLRERSTRNGNGEDRRAAHEKLFHLTLVPLQEWRPPRFKLLCSLKLTPLFAASGVAPVMLLLHFCYSASSGLSHSPHRLRPWRRRQRPYCPNMLKLCDIGGTAKVPARMMQFCNAAKLFVRWRRKMQKAGNRLPAFS